MGRQIRFVMEVEDELKFWEFISEDPKNWVFNPPYKTNKPDKLIELPDRYKPWGGSLIIWNEELSPEGLMKYVKEQEYWLVDKFSAETIEFMRSARIDPDDGQLKGGRLWYDRFYCDEFGNKLIKNPALDALYDHLAKWIRKHGALNKSEGYYYLPKAKEKWWPEDN